MFNNKNNFQLNSLNQIITEFVFQMGCYTVFDEKLNTFQIFIINKIISLHFKL